MSERNENGRERSHVHDLPYGRAELWFDRRGETVELCVKHQNSSSASGGGSQNWTRCTTQRCLGEALAAGGTCLAHADQPTRRAFLQHIRGTNAVLPLRGIDLSKVLYTEILSSPVFENGAPRIPINLAGADISAELRFEDKVFDCWLSLFGARVFAPLSFRGCTLRSNIDARFVFFDKGPPSFFRCKFEESVDFSFSRARSVSIALEQCEFAQAFTADGSRATFLLDKSTFKNGLFIRNADAASEDGSVILLNGASVDGEMDPGVVVWPNVVACWRPRINN